MVNIFIEAKDRKTSEAEFLTAILNRLGIPADLPGCVQDW